MSGQNDRRGSYRDPMPMPEKKNTFAKVMLIGLLLFLAGAYVYENHIKDADFSKFILIKEKAKKIVNDDAVDDAFTSNEFSEDDISVDESLADDEDVLVAAEDVLMDVKEIVSEYEKPQSSTSTSSTPSSTPSKAAEKPKKEKEDYGSLSTLEIIERKNHENAVEQARRAGVSTEGSTMDILERINHKNVVEQGKKAGVSTEGSTMDILERINRKSLEKYGY